MFVNIWPLHLYVDFLQTTMLEAYNCIGLFAIDLHLVVHYN